MNLGKDKPKVQPRICSECGLLKHCVDPVTGVCIDCHAAVRGPIGPALDLMGETMEEANKRLLADLVQYRKQWPTEAQAMIQGFTPDGIKRAEDAYCAALGRNLSEGTGEAENALDGLQGRMVEFIRGVANTANHTRRHEGGPLNVWTAHPELHVTARRILDDIEGEES